MRATLYHSSMRNIVVDQSPLICVIEGVSVVLHRIGADERLIEVEWRAEESDVTREMSIEWDRQMRAWSTAESRTGEPPEMPGNILARVSVEIATAEGVPLRFTSAEFAGQSTEWVAISRFEASDGETAELLIQFYVDGDHVRSIGVQVQ